MSQGPGNMGTPPDYSFQMAVLRELDQLRRTVEDAVRRLDQRDEERDADVSELKLQVAAIRAQHSAPTSNLKRDGGLVVSTGTVVAVLAGLAQWLATPPAPPAPPAPRPPVAQVQGP